MAGSRVNTSDLQFYHHKDTLYFVLVNAKAFGDLSDLIEMGKC